MNRCYRVIFNYALGVWQCVSEIAKARGKSSSKTVLAPLAVAVAMASSPAMALVYDGIHNLNELNITDTSNSIHKQNTIVNTNALTVSSYPPARLEVYDNAQLNVSGDADVGKSGVGELHFTTGAKGSVHGSLNLGVNQGSSGFLNIAGIGAGQDKGKTRVYAKTINVGNNGQIAISDDGTLSADSINIGGGELQIFSGGNLNVGNIIRDPQQQGEALIAFNNADIKIEGGNQNNFFAGFTTNDRIEFSDGGLEFNTNGFDVTINPNAIIRNVSTKPVDEQIGFVKRGKGTLTMHLDTVDVGDILTIDDGVVKIIGQDHALNGEELRIRLTDANNYGQLLWEGKLDVSKGKLSVQARDAVRQLINNNTAAQWNDVVKATTLSGQFGQFDVVDDNGNSMQNTGLNPVYAGNSVHLKLDGTTTPTTPTTPTNVYDFPFHEHFPYNQNPSALAMAPAFAHVLENNDHLKTTLNLNFNRVANKEQAAAQLISELQPTVNAQAANVVYEQQNMITQSINDRIFGTRTSIAQGSDSADTRSLFRRSDDLSNQVWVQTFAYDHNLDEKNQMAGYDGNSYGAIVGMDGMLSDNLKLGVALGYSKGDIDSTATIARQNLKSDSVQAYVYGDYAANDATHLNGFVSYGNSNMETQRDITVVDTYQAKADYDSDILQVGIGVDHRIGSEHNHISPYAQLRFTKISNDAYQETGLPDSLSALHYQVAKQSYNTLRSTLGVHFAKSVGNNTQLVGHLAGHAEQFNDQNTQFAFAGQPDVSFVGSTQERKRFSGSAGLGLRHQLSTTTEISGQYAGEFRSNQQDHGVILQFKHKF